MNSLKNEFDDIMELFIGINYDMEKMRDAGYIEITDNLVILRDMLEKFQSRLSGPKTLPRAQPKQKTKPLPKVTPPKKVPAKKVPAKKQKSTSSESESGSN